MSGEAGSGQPAVGSVPRTSFLDDDLSKLSVEDLRRVRMWVEDRFTNAITSRGADRLSEYDRGMIAAAKHIERRIREVKIP